MNRIGTKLICLVAAVTLTAGVGCHEDLNTEELTTRTSSLTTDLVVELVQSIEFLMEVEAFESLGRVLDGWLSEEEISVSGPGEPPFAPIPPEDGETGDFDPDEIAAEIQDILENYVFTEEYLESERPGHAVYLFPGSLFCESDDDYMCEPYECFGDPICEQEALEWEQECLEDAADSQAECESALDALELRIELSQSGDHGVAIELQVGPEQSRILRLVLNPNGIKIEIDLGGMSDAVAHILSVVGGEELELPEIMEGKLAMALERNGEMDFTLSSEISEAVRVKMDIPELGTFDFSAEEAVPASSIHIQGLEKKLSAGFDANAISFEMPMAAMYESATGSLLVDLAGLEGGLTVSDTDTSLKFTGLGIGDATSVISHDGTEIASIDLNTADGRHFALEISDLDGMPLFDFEPGVALNAFVDFCHFDQFLEPDEEPAPAELCDQTYGLILESDNGHPQLLPVETVAVGEEMPEEFLKVVAGSLTLSTTAVATTFVAEEGQCITDVVDCVEGSHLFVECLTTVTCP